MFGGMTTNFNDKTISYICDFFGIGDRDIQQLLRLLCLCYRTRTAKT